MMPSPISSSSSSDTFWSKESASEIGEVHKVENIILYSFAHHACSALLEGHVYEEELVVYDGQVRDWIGYRI